MLETTGGLVMAQNEAGKNNAGPTKRSSALPLVSVVIPAYNGASTLAESLDSVLAQTYPNIETVVVDDGSLDNTSEVLRRYGDKVRSIRQPNGGLASARNLGLKHACGDYIALLDADDICLPGRIALQVAFLEAHPELVLCSSDFSAFDKSGDIATSFIGEYYNSVGRRDGGVASLFARRADIKPEASALTTAVPAYAGNVYERVVEGNFIHPPTVLFRRSLVDTVGAFDGHLKNMCDYDWLIRVSRIGQVGYIDRPLIRYRLSESQMSGDRNQVVVKLDLVQVLANVRSADPELYARKRGEFRRRIGSCYLSAADAQTDTKKAAAFGNLLRSLGYAVVDVTTLKVIIKLLLPRRLVQAYRRRKYNA
ncbi:MAG: glycosyltransferase [Gammaproteobacteria bacterium]|nr:glycosyltransferase [Gammaproteobacteria bacterium]